MSRSSQLLFSLLSIVLLCGCQSLGPNARGGSALGGTTGALAGAAIGAHNGNTLEGALLGGALGTLAGATVGDAVDELEYRDRFNQQQAMVNRQQAAVTADQLVQMTTSGLSEELIISQIQSGGCASRLTTNNLIALKQRGVSDRVLSAYQNCGMAEQRPVRQLYAAPVAIPYDAFDYGHHPHHAIPIAPCLPPPRYGRSNRFGIHVGF